MKQLKYLVTGTGRSGTVFMARFLTSIGISCGHETIFDFNGIDTAKERLIGQQEFKLSSCSTVKFDHDTNAYSPVDWHPDVKNIIADSSYMAAPFLKDDILESTTIIHVVRNPIDVINSFCNSIDYFSPVNASDDYENFILSNVPELKQKMPQYDKAALYYILWNTMIEQSNPDLFFRIEDDPKLLLDKLNIPNDAPYFCEKTVNTFERIRLEKFDCSKIESKIIRSKLYQMADKYNYKIRPILVL